MEKIKVYNARKYAIGLILQNGAERVILPGSFALLTRDDIEYAGAIAPQLFVGEKQLYLEDRQLAAQLGFIDDPAVPRMDAEEIRKKLGMRPAQVKAWLDTVQDDYLLDAICDVAATMDLPASKLQLLQDRLPARDFLKAE